MGESCDTSDCVVEGITVCYNKYIVKVIQSYFCLGHMLQYLCCVVRSDKEHLSVSLCHVIVLCSVQTSHWTTMRGM